MARSRRGAQAFEFEVSGVWAALRLLFNNTDFFLNRQIEPQLGELSDHLTLRTFIVGYELSAADTTIWAAIRNNRVAHAYIKQNLMPNLCRW